MPLGKHMLSLQKVCSVCKSLPFKDRFIFTKDFRVATTQIESPMSLWAPLGRLLCILLPQMGTLASSNFCSPAERVQISPKSAALRPKTWHKSLVILKSSTCFGAGIQPPLPLSNLPQAQPMLLPQDLPACLRPAYLFLLRKTHQQPAYIHLSLP